MNIDELKNRLDDEFPNIYKCVLINGNWGIGKTYFLKNEFLKEKDYVYVQLFGLETMEEVKIEMYSQLNKVLNFLKNKVYNKVVRNGLNISGDIGSLSVPYLENNIKEAIERKCKNKELIIVVDDIERKSPNIRLEDILGVIESISEIENASVILVANESKIKEKEVYENFKEKVVQKTYNVDEYSKNAISEILNMLLQNIELKNDYKILMKQTIEDTFYRHGVKNLRTLQKAIKFTKLLLKHINIEQLLKSEFIDIILTGTAITIEKIEGIYFRQNEDNSKKEINTTEKLIYENGKGMEYCVICYYMKEPYIVNNKKNLVTYILDIYEDIKIKDNFDNINKFYEDLHKVKNTEDENKEMFYMNEQQLKNSINNFNEKYIKNVELSIDVYNWFKMFCEVYYYAEIIGLDNIFKEELIIKDMDLYIDKTRIENDIYQIIRKNIPYDIRSEKVLEYKKILDIKIVTKYYNNIVDKIIINMKNGKYDAQQLDNIFSIFINNFVTVNKNEFINKLKNYKFFIPDLNEELTDEEWGWTHSIWEKAKGYEEQINKEFVECVQELLKNANTIGKYRINSLNKQYNIKLQN